jgi:RNA polymerase sigma-70 factor (ECF subfamily)
MRRPPFAIARLLLLRVAVHRLRQRYRRALHDEIAQTVGDESEVEEEMNCLRQILSCQ